MKKKIAILSILFIILVIAIAPAKLAQNFIPSNNQLSLGSITGTIWSGHIETALVKGWRFKDLTYQTNILPLLTGNAGGEVKINKGDLTGSFEFSIADKENLSLTEAELIIVASQLEEIIPFPGIQLDGELSTNDVDLTIENKKLTSLTGTTKWKDALVSVRNKRWELGEFVIDWTTDEAEKIILGKIRKTNNLLKVEGVISLSASGILEFKGSIANTIDKSIYTAFQLFADGKVNQGRLPIKFKKKIQ